MTIGLLTTSFPRSESDIAGNFVLGFARQLHGLGHRVQVLAPEPAEPGARRRYAAVGAHAIDGKGYEHEHEYEYEYCQANQLPSDSPPSIEVHHIPYLRPRALQRTFYGAGVPDNLARDPLAWLGPVPFCANLYLQTRRAAPRWQALVSHWALPCALAAGAARCRHQRHIAVLHSADIHALSRLPLGARLAGRVAQGASALWFVSEAQRERFLALVPRVTALPPTLVCPMGVDLPPPSAADADLREEYRRRHGLHGFCVLLLGRLVHIKGVDVALQAAAAGGMTLLIAGDGPLRRELTQRAQQLGAAARFLGVVTGADKHALLQAADAFALPSRQLASGRSEGLPCALLEALAAGLPVAATRLPGVDSLLCEQAPRHVLVPAEAPAALRTALLSLREQREARAARDPRRYALIARYGWPAVGERLAGLLRGVEVQP